MDRHRLRKTRSPILSIEANLINWGLKICITQELSGLGDRKKLSAVAMEDRYENLCTVAKTRSIIALGLSCFTNTTDGAASSTSYRAETFNVVALCDEDYIVEPGAIRFLVQHGFDFQQQYNGGVMYCRGNDRIATKTKPTTPEENRLRDLFSLLVRSKKSLVAHNGLVDLVFLYQNLYAQLPTDLQSFIADLTEMFPGGIYDTKYMADFIVRSPASYLEYVFRREYVGLCTNIEVFFN
jgi:target of EGR1 protein 1